MKNLLLIIVTIVFSSITISQTVNKNEAELVGKNYFYQRVERLKDIKYNDVKIESIDLISKDNLELYYVINFKEDGFIIVSADKNTVPILAYSIDKNFEGEIPPAVSFWLNRYAKQIKFLKENNVKSIENNNKWDEILTFNHKNPKQIDDIYIDPLVHSEWDQGTYYNASCPPAYGPDGHCVTGCVATATAQLLYYHRFPYSGTGSYSYDCPGFGTISEDFSTATYDYENMPYKFTNYSESGALLLYHLGVTFDMFYGPDGSAVWNHSVDNSLRTYFKYCPETQYVFRDSTTLDWDSIVVTNLLANKPLYYAGWEDTTFQSGHAFVCDGYDGPNYYHFNFGWGGSYNGWFYTDDITPATYQFTYAQELIKDIYPDTNLYTYPQTCSGTKSIEYSIGSVEDGSGINNYEPNSDCTWQINPTCGLIVDAYLDEFNLEAGDTLYIYDGNESENSLIDFYVKDSEPKLSWMSVPDLYSAQSGELMINFKSDNSLEARGWKISYFADFCKFGTTETDSVGTIEDGSEICNYEPNTGCKWTIQPPGAEAIRINFTEFNLDTNNTYDNVRIFKDAAGGTNQIAKFTIDNLPTEVIVPSGVAVITFTTSPTSSGQGWSFDYETTTLQNVNIIQDKNISIFPNPTKDFVNIKSDKKINNILVTDISGRILISNKTNCFSTKVDISELQKGIYLINVDNYITKIILE